MENKSIATQKEISPLANKESIGNASGFVQKLYKMVNCAPDDIISWVPAGDAFRISDLQRLESETLPSFFRHSRFQSLVRQLNFYNFRKVNRERNFWIYRHKQFHRDRPQQLHLLRRRTCPGVDGRKQRPENESSSRGKSSHENNAGKSKFSPSSEYISLKSNDAVEQDVNMFHKHQEMRMSRESSHQNLFFTHSQSDNIRGDTRNWEQDAGKMRQAHLRPNDIVSSVPNRRGSFGNNEQHIIGGGTKLLSRPDGVETNAFPVHDDNVKVEFVSNYPSSDALTSNIERETKSCVTPGDEGKVNESSLQLPMDGKKNWSEIEGQGFKIVEKLSRAEQNKHSLLVSQVARELEIYAKRAAESGLRGGKGKGRGRRSGILVVDGRGAGGLVTPPPVLGDTMRYNALTYDDEYSRLDVDSSEVLKSEVVVTDESDNSESDDIVSVIKKATSTNQESISSRTQYAQDHTITKASTHHYSELAVDKMMIASISNKLLNGLGPHESGKSENFHLVSASLVYFCMSNNPLEPELGSKVHLLLETCMSLRDDFDQYRRALFPGPTYFQKSSISSELNNQNSQCCDMNTVRDFKVFAVNCMEETLVQNSICMKQCSWPIAALLNEMESKVLQVSKSLWCQSIIGKA